VKTAPGHRLNEAEIRLVQNAVCTRIGLTGLYRSNDGDVADIDAQVLEDELASGALSSAEFELFCETSGVTVRDEEGGLSPSAAQAFLENKWGQELFTVELPTAEAAACKIYAGLAAFAREHRFRLWAPVPGVGDIDPSMPGRLPPLWHRYSSGEAMGGQESDNTSSSSSNDP
jgi:hypothetical protein